MFNINSDGWFETDSLEELELWMRLHLHPREPTHRRFICTRCGEEDCRSLEESDKLCINCEGMAGG